MLLTRGGRTPDCSSSRRVEPFFSVSVIVTSEWWPGWNGFFFWGGGGGPGASHLPIPKAPDTQHTRSLRGVRRATFDARRCCTRCHPPTSGKGAAACHVENRHFHLRMARSPLKGVSSTFSPSTAPTDTKRQRNAQWAIPPRHAVRSHAIPHARGATRPEATQPPPRAAPENIWNLPPTSELMLQSLAVSPRMRLVSRSDSYTTYVRVAVWQFGRMVVWNAVMPPK